MTCKDCKKRATCTKICPEIERQLPSMKQGRTRGTKRGLPKNWPQ